MASMALTEPARRAGIHTLKRTVTRVRATTTIIDTGLTNSVKATSLPAPAIFSMDGASAPRTGCGATEADRDADGRSYRGYDHRFKDDGSADLPPRRSDGGEQAELLGSLGYRMAKALYMRETQAIMMTDASMAAKR